MWEIAENLHRAELTALERSEHVSEWIQLAERKAAQVLLQDATKLSKRGRDGEGRPESGVRAAARELNIESTAAHRAVKVASLSDAAKEAARETGLDDNRSALLDAAAKSEEEQAERIREIAREKEMRRKLREMTAQDKKPATSAVTDCVVGEFRRLWLAASEEDKRTIYDIVKRHYASQSAA